MDHKAPTWRSKAAGKTCCAAPKFSYVTMCCRNCGCGYLYTVTKGNCPDDAVTFDTNDIADTRLDAPYVQIRLNLAITQEMLEEGKA